MTNILVDDWNALRLKYRKNVEKTISWANMIIKFNYDRRHISFDLSKKFKVYLRLHHEYIISKIINKKLAQQRVEWFKILNKIDNLVYRLKFSSIMIIHLIVSMTHLKSMLVDRDLYDKARFDDENSSFVIIKNNDFVSYYEIEFLIEKWTSREKTQYLVKWQSYKLIHNVLYNIDDFVIAQKLIDKYEKKTTIRLDLSTRARYSKKNNSIIR